MRLCLKCRRISPRGSLYCSSCGLAFGGSRCEHGHFTPGLGSIRVCPLCRSTQVVQPTASLNLSLLTRAVSWTVALLALRWGFAHLDLLTDLAGSGLAWVLGRGLFGSLGSLLFLAVALRVFVWLVGLFNPEGARKLEPLGKLLPWLLKAFGKAALEIAHVLCKAVEGKSFRSRDKKKEKGQ